MAAENVRPSPTLEGAAEAGYCAFLEALGECRPAWAQSWEQLSPMVRIAWMQAAAAVLQRADDRTDT